MGKKFGTLTLIVTLLVVSLSGCGNAIPAVDVVPVDYSYKTQLEPQEVVTNKVMQPVVIDETQADPDESYTWAALRSRLGLSFLNDSMVERIFNLMTASKNTEYYDLDPSGLLKTEYVTEPLEGSDGNKYLFLKGKYYQCDSEGYVEVCVTNCTALNFRTGPSVGNSILGTVHQGGHMWAKASAYMSDGSTWYRTKNKDGQLGWQHSYYLQLPGTAIEKPENVSILTDIQVTAEGEIVVSFPEFDKSKTSLTAAYVFMTPGYLKDICMSCGQTQKDCDEKGCRQQVMRKLSIAAGEEVTYYNNFNEVKAANPSAKEADYGWFWIFNTDCDNCVACNHVPCLEGLELEYTLALDNAEKGISLVTIPTDDKNTSDANDENDANENNANTENTENTENTDTEDNEDRIQKFDNTPHEYIPVIKWDYFTEAKTATERQNPKYWAQAVKRYQDTDTVVFTGAGFHNEQIDIESEDLVLLTLTTNSLTVDTFSPYSVYNDTAMRTEVCGYVLLDTAEVWALVPLYDIETGKVKRHGWVYVTTLLSAEEYVNQSFNWLRFFETFGYSYKALTPEDLSFFDADDVELYVNQVAATQLTANSRLTEYDSADIWLNTFAAVFTKRNDYERAYVEATLEWLNNLKRESALQ